MLTLQVRLFAAEARAAGVDRLSVCVPAPATAGQVLTALGEQAPALRESLASARLAVNHAFAAVDQPVTAADELALIGMVSGG